MLGILYCGPRNRVLPRVLLIVLCVFGSSAADWPMYRGDAARTASTSDTLGKKLELAWVHRASHAPCPAWPRSPRMQFDRAFHVAVAGQRVVYGNSADGTVTALDLNSGDVVWQFSTDGPVRFAPAIWRDRAFVASDDGFLYALRLGDGQLLWKRRGGPDATQVLGNGQLISKWPARGGPVVADERVYFAAGIWPTDGIYLYALDADSGNVIWRNADSGAIYMPQPHGGANARSGISAQGYLVVSGDLLLVPTGRAVPACFDRTTGEFRYFHLQLYGHNGETPTMAVGDTFFNGGLSFRASDGQLVFKLGPGQLARAELGIICAAGMTLAEYRWQDKQGVDRKGNPISTRVLEAAWTVKDTPAAAAILAAGDQVVIGGQDLVCGVDRATGNQVTWTIPVDGVAHGLALVEGHLLVSTSRGQICCLGPPSGVRVRKTTVPLRDVEVTVSTAVAEAADEILGLADVRAGYCVDLACGDGMLARALAERSKLFVIAVDADAANVQRARDVLRRAGLYGRRVVVQQRDPAATAYPQFFADLVVSQASLTREQDGFPVAEAHRLQRPWGGVICVGRPGQMVVSRRGPLDGAGHWTHQYADPANTTNSQDEHVRGRLTMHWFRDQDIELSQRHGRPPAPLFAEGRLFHEGLDGLIAVNAYNGQSLWRFPIPGVLKAYDGDELMGVAGTGSNYCVGGDSVFIRHEDRCYRLNAADGRVVREFRTPDGHDGVRSPWGYVAWSDGVLFGSEANPRHVVTYRYLDRGGDMSRQLSESRALFALDPDSGRMRWRYAARASIRHNAIAVADNRVVLIDRPLAVFDQVKRPPSKEHALGTLIALKAQTGGELWRQEQNIYGTLLAISEPHRIVLMSYQPTRFRLDSELGGRMAAFHLDDGSRLWDIEADYQSRPIINDRTIYAQGGAWDLVTGEPVPFKFTRSYGCGILAGSKHMLLFRSATLGYYDLSGARTTEDYGGMRPGCWINTLPVGGLVLVPDATAGCECSYLNRAWVALEPVPDTPTNDGSAGGP